MKKLTFLSIALILVSGILSAQKFDGMRCDQHKMMPNMNQAKPMMAPDAMLNCIDELKLTDAQKKKFEELRTAFRKTENTLAAEIENLRIDMKGAIKNENFKAAKDLNKQISTKESTLEDARLDFLAARMNELTPDQKKILKDNMSQMMMQHKCQCRTAWAWAWAWDRVWVKA